MKSSSNLDTMRCGVLCLRCCACVVSFRLLLCVNVSHHIAKAACRLMPEI